VIYGENLLGLADRLRNQPGVDQTIAFGSALHVSGTDVEALRRTLEPLAQQPGLRLEPIPTGLEDAFVYLMNRSSQSGDAASGESAANDPASREPRRR
jgi:ABC-2 type transport system ATP-binding protein